MPICVICKEEFESTNVQNTKLCGSRVCKQKNSNNNNKIRHAKMSKEQKRAETRRYTQSRIHQKVRCKCPRCGKEHIHRFEYGYSGSLMPYKFCPMCAKYIQRDYYEVRDTRLYA